MKKKILSLMLAVMLLIGCVALPASAAASFSDVSSGAWYAKFVNYVYDNGLMSGTGASTFSPDAKMTRAMAVTVLYRIAGSPEVSGSNSFTDVPASQYYYKPVLWAVANGITSGVSATRFGPNENVTREQLVTFLYKYACTTDLWVGAGGKLNYPDAGSVSGYAVTSFLWCTANGIVSGNEKGQLAPKATATRAECATILTRFDELVKASNEPDPTEPPATEPTVTEPPVTEPDPTTPSTEPPVTEPPVTEPPVTEPPVTEPPVTEPPVTECQHDYAVEHHDEVGHWDYVSRCYCGFKFNDVKEHQAHVQSIIQSEGAEVAIKEHGGYATNTDANWIIDEPAYDVYTCTKCGHSYTTKE